MVLQKLEQKPLSLIKAPVPFNATLGSSEPHTFIFMSEKALTTPDKLLILVPGSQVQIGQWSRRVMCDENINDGSMATVCSKAFSQGYEVIITNPNANYWFANQSWVSVYQMRPASSHTIAPSAAIAHSRLKLRSKGSAQIQSTSLKVIPPRLISTMSLKIM